MFNVLGRKNSTAVVEHESPREQQAAPSPVALEALIERLEQYGHPHFYHNKDGWCVSVDMFVQGKGNSFKVQSEFGHKKVHSAVEECLSRIEAILKALR